MKAFVSCLFLCITSQLLFSQRGNLQSEINTLVKDKKATVGVAVIQEGDTICTFNDSIHYPTLSVFKFYQALAVLKHLDDNHLSLDMEIEVLPADLLPNTYSPLRNKYPEGVKISVKELLQYSVSQSDNNACDILFKYIAGVDEVNRYIKSLGIKNIQVKASEADMHNDFNNLYLNWSTPTATATLLEKFLKEEMFSKPLQEFLENTLTGTITGQDKIKALLPTQVIVGHKTGTSMRNDEGAKIADNDAGFVILPDQRKYTIAIFIYNSLETDQENAAMIANISKTVYDYFMEMR